MQISQKLFNQQAINNFAKLDAEIQKIQEQVSTGKISYLHLMIQLTQ